MEESSLSVKTFFTLYEGFDHAVEAPMDYIHFPHKNVNNFFSKGIGIVKRV